MITSLLRPSDAGAGNGGGSMLQHIQHDSWRYHSFQPFATTWSYGNHHSIIIILETIPFVKLLFTTFSVAQDFRTEVSKHEIICTYISPSEKHCCLHLMVDVVCWQDPGHTFTKYDALFIPQMENVSLILIVEIRSSERAKMFVYIHLVVC